MAPLGHPTRPLNCSYWGTTGLLKEQSKLSLLYARAEAVRKSLKDSNNTFQRVMPVIVSSRTTAEIKADIEAAERLGILVISREGLDEMINRTLLQPNPDQIYNEAEQAISTALAKYAEQPMLPLASPRG